MHRFNLRGSRDMVELRSYQQDALTAIRSAAGRGLRRLLASLPTGTGKTIIFAALIHSRPGRALVLAHRDELIGQAVDKLRVVDPGADIGVVKAERNELDHRITVASVQTLARSARLDQLGAFETVVVDEAHHSTAETYRRILEYVGAFADPGPLTVGVTATAFRADSDSLGSVWEDVVYHTDILTMIRQGYLSDLRAVRVQLTALHLDQVHTRHGDLVAGELGDAMSEASAPRHAAEAYQKYAAGRKALVFTPTVALAYEMMTEFVKAGVRTEALDGTTPLEERRAILERLHTGETRVVCNCAVLTEGFDEPSIDCIITARPTKSLVLYTQMIGRGTRRYPGKEDCTIIDLVDNTTRHDLIALPDLVGLPKGVLANSDETVFEAVERMERGRAERDLAREMAQQREGKLVARTVELFKRRPMHWVSNSPTLFALSLGEHGTLTLKTEDHVTWRVVQVGKDRQRLVIGEGFDLGYAQGIAEDHVRSLGVGALTNPRARWRRNPATDSQLGYLARYRIHYEVGITKGEASDLLSAYFAGRVA